MKSRYMYVQDGAVIIDSFMSLKDMPESIFDEIILIIDKFKSDVASIEDISFAKNKNIFMSTPCYKSKIQFLDLVGLQKYK
ncbi:hypothetical protein [Borrelia hermsii]|uniref:hypothetical protein n=1 Tax=Borrelia hermsii TaxID=140 RepID=UPI0003E33681|nr:hypothetical protein [Borrelia hermsii]AHH13528.1 Crossover junction endodeoxyribonuclease ruvC [Borrelia hermsii MTW]